MAFSLGCTSSQPAATAPSSTSTSSPTSPATPSTGGVAGLTLSGTAPFVGASAQFTAMAAMSDNSKRSVNAEASWQSSNTAVATVDAGIVKGVSAGEADISATYQDVSARLHIAVVVGSPLTTVSVSGASPRVGASSQFTASATRADNSVTDVTSQAAWSSSNTSVATVNGGVVTGVAAGDADISAVYQNITGTMHVVVAASVPAPTPTPTPAPSPPCTLVVSPTTLSPASYGGIFTVNVTVQGPNCGWSATSSDPFVTIMSGASGNGSGAVTISVSTNTGAARSAVLTIGGKQVTVSQAAGTCVTLLNPLGVNFVADFGEDKVTVEAQPGCQWTATSTASFITFPSGATGTGNGSFTYRVQGNLTGGQRSGSIKLAQFTLNITQFPETSNYFLSFVSDVGDYIGQGWTVVAGNPTSSVMPTLDASHNHISFHTTGSFSPHAPEWTLDLAAPQGQQLKPGTYLSAKRYGLQGASAPGLNLSGDGRACNTITGQFTITDAVFAADGSVQRFAASFEQHCEGAGPALHGNITFGR